MIARRCARVIAFAVLVASATAALVAGCGRGPSRHAPKVLILGIDGFDWNIIDPLVVRGRMPAMAQLLAEGTRADLLTLVPLEKSPVIWTTIATGHLPDVKGRGFLVAGEPGSARAYTSWHRTTRAFWNILPPEKITVAVLGWLETWPAERIGGAIVSDYVQYDVAEGDKAQRLAHRTYPESLFAEIESLVVYPKDVSDERIAPLLGAALDPSEPDEAIRRGVEDLRWIFAGDLTFTALAEEWLSRRPEDVVAVYLRGPDAVCHKFWGDRERRAAGEQGVRRVALFGETIDRYYEETDRFIARILARIDLSRTTLLLVSDHGFQGGREGLDGSVRAGIWMHRELGTILVAGPGAKGRGLREKGARVVDVFPTLLHLLDLPVGDDMDGEPARWLLSRAAGSERPVRHIRTWETGEKPEIPGALASPVDEQIRERVEALGYAE